MKGEQTVMISEHQQTLNYTNEDSYYFFFDKLLNIACLCLTQDINYNSLCYLAEQTIYVDHYDRLVQLDPSLQERFLELKLQITDQLTFYNNPELKNDNFLDISSQLIIYILFLKELRIESHLNFIILDTIFTLISNNKVTRNTKQKVMKKFLDEKILFYKEIYARYD